MWTVIGNYKTTRRRTPIYRNVESVVWRFSTPWSVHCQLLQKSERLLGHRNTGCKQDGFLEYVEHVQLAASQWWPCFLWNHVESSEYLLASWAYSPFCVKNRLRILRASSVATSAKWNFPFNSVGFWNGTWRTEVIFLWTVSYNFIAVLLFGKRLCFSFQVKEST